MPIIVAFFKMGILNFQNFTCHIVQSQPCVTRFWQAVAKLSDMFKDFEDGVCVSCSSGPAPGSGDMMAELEPEWR